MSEYTTSRGVWNGWHWRFVGLTVLALTALQIIAFYAFKYPIATSLPLAVMLVVYLVVPRVKERRLQNTVAGVVALFAIGVVCELLLDVHLKGPGAQAAAAQVNVRNLAFWSSNAFVLVFGLGMSYLFLRLTQWSERKRAELEAKRNAEAAKQRTVPVRRHHGKKKKRKKR